MPKVQFQKGSLVSSIPKEVIKALELEKGDYINFNILKNGQVKLIKVIEEAKRI